VSGAALGGLAGALMPVSNYTRGPPGVDGGSAVRRGLGGLTASRIYFTCGATYDLGRQLGSWLTANHISSARSPTA